MKAWIRNWVLKNLLSAVIEKDILTTDKYGNIYLQGQVLTENEARMLKGEANLFTQTRLWSILTNTPKHQAEKVMFSHSKTYGDMVSGKMMLYTIDVQEKIVKKLSQLNLK